MRHTGDKNDGANRASISRNESDNALARRGLAGASVGSLVDGVVRSLPPQPSRWTHQDEAACSAMCRRCHRFIVWGYVETTVGKCEDNRKYIPLDPDLTPHPCGDVGLRHDEYPTARSQADKPKAPPPMLTPDPSNPARLLRVEAVRLMDADPTGAQQLFDRADHLDAEAAR